MAQKHIYAFGGGKAEGNKDMKDLLGGKGAGLAEMSNIGIPVPPGFTITTEVCTEYYRAGKKLPKWLEAEVRAAMKKTEALAGKRFGDAKNPLLVSVRSGARASMPGMMDTVLNLGLNDVTVAALARTSQNPRFAWDSYRRFVAMFGDVVLGMKPEKKEDRDPFEEILERKKQAHGVRFDSELPEDALRELVAEFKAEIRERKGTDFPEDPYEQLMAAVAAVFRSWDNDRAIAYRQLYGYPSEWGTAVSVQAMVFGNLGEDSGTGVAFTRDPATGDDRFYGEFLVNAQGEDVVAGIRTPQKIAELAARWPDIARQLEDVRERLERHYQDMQDIEFTIEKGKLYVLQTRTGKRTGLAAVRIAVDMVDEGLITKEQALLRIEPEALNHLLRPIFDAERKAAALKQGRLLAKGLPAGPGAASGRLVFFAEDAAAWRARGEAVVLARHETSPEDIRGMAAAEGFLTAFGGMTSHAALVARQMGKVAIVGCEALSFDYHGRKMKVATPGGERTVSEGDWISIDGTAGEVIEGKLETRPSRGGAGPRGEDARVRGRPRLPRVRRGHGVGGRGPAPRRPRERRPAGSGRGRGRLRRPGHRPLPHRAHVLRRGEDRADARDDRRGDRRGAARGAREAPPGPARGLPRHLRGDGASPRHDPHARSRRCTSSCRRTRRGSPSSRAATGKPLEKIRARIEELHEANPMLGHRGCRLGISYPEITEMQARAIFEAACDVAEQGVKVEPEVMIPLVGDEARARRPGRDGPARRGGGLRRARAQGEVRGRHDDRGPARRAHRRRDREDRRVLLLRHERPHADDVRPLPRRHRRGPRCLPREGHLAGRSVRLDRPRGRRRAHEDRRPSKGAPRSRA